MSNVTLNQVHTDDVRPRQSELFNDDDLVIEVDMGEAEPDGAGDLYTPMDYQLFKDLFEADLEWVADTINKMAEVTI